MNVQYELMFSDKIRKIITELIIKYQLEIDQNLSLLEIIKKPDPEIFIFKLAGRILRREGKFKDISEMLKKELHMHQKQADALAQDIKDKVVILAEEIPIIKEVKAYQEEIVPGLSTQEILLEKLRGKEAPPQEKSPAQGAPNPPITPKPIREEPKNPINQPIEKQKKEDSYREPLE